MTTAQPPGPCAADGCGVGFEPGDYWWYHSRLNAYIHDACWNVKGENVVTHCMFRGRVPFQMEEEE